MKIRDKLFFTISFLILFSISTLSQSSIQVLEDPAQFKSKLTEMSQKTNTIESTFTQEKNLSFLSEKIFSKGLFYFKKENKIRWQYTEPFAYLIIINENEIYINDEDNETKLDLGSNKVFGEINKIIRGCVQGDILNNEEEYKIEYYEGTDIYLVKLTPYSDQMKEFLNTIKIHFDKQDYSVAMLEMIELSGDYTKIEFTDKKLNTEIADKIFTNQ